MSFTELDIFLSFNILILSVVALILIWISYTDIRFRIIKNEASLLIVGLFAISSIAKILVGVSTFEALVVPVTVAAIVFAIMLGLFALNYLGGGDAKFISAFALIASQSYIIDFILYMAVAGGAVAAVTLLLNKFSNVTQQPASIITDTQKVRPEMVGDLYLASVASGPDGNFKKNIRSYDSPSSDKPIQLKAPYGVAITLSGFWVIIQQLGQLNGG